MQPIQGYISQDESKYTSEEKEVLATSSKFWTVMENADEGGMRAIADSNCTFVHIGVVCELNKEIAYYTSGKFKPTSITFNGKTVKLFGETAIVLSDCNYTLLLDGTPTTHHFSVTETYSKNSGSWKLVQFSFTPLIS